MANILRNASAGKILAGAGGIFGDGIGCCCVANCGTAGCNRRSGAGTSPTTTPINCPSLKLRVSGATGTINWAGQTWTLPADSGKCKVGCPISYLIGNYTQTFVNTLTTTTTAGPGTQLTPNKSYRRYHFGIERWSAIGLNMERQRLVETFSTTYFGLNGCAQNFALNTLNVQGSADVILFFGPTTACATTPFVPTFTSISSSLLGKITAAAVPQFTSYRLLTSWFSPCPCVGGTPVSCSNAGVTVGGITYHWEKDTNWP